jgi:hypothetical protein
MVKEEPLAMATLKNVECRNYSFVLLWELNQDY